MGYAPYSRITTPPDPATSGTAFSVQEDSGPRFPAVPFVALVWHDQTLPDLGVDAEELTILSIDMDDFTCAPRDGIEITSDMQIAILYSQSRYDLDSPATLTSDEFPVSDTGVELRIRDSQGSVATYTTDALAAYLGPGGGSVFALTFLPEHSGQSFYRFDSDQRAQAEQDFFVRFSDVL